MDEKFNKEKEATQKEERDIMRAVIEPLQREINSLRGEVRELKKVAESQKTAIIDDGTRREIRGMMESAAVGIDSYKPVIYVLFAIVIILAGSILWNTHKISEITENMDWKYDVVTGVLSSDRAYWWDGENYIASRKAPEAKRLQEAIEKYNKINTQMKIERK